DVYKRQKEAWKESFFGKIKSDEEFSDFLNSLASAGFTPERFLNHHLRINAGVDLKDMVSLFEGSLVFHLSTLNMKEDDLSKAVEQILLLRVTDKQKEVIQKIVENLTHSFSKSPPFGTKFSASKTEYKSLSISSLSFDTLKMHTTFWRDFWAFSFEVESLKRLLEIPEGKNFAEEPSTCHLSVFCDGKRLVEGLEGAVGVGVKEALSAVVKLFPQFIYFAEPKEKGYKERFLVKHSDSLPQGFRDTLNVPSQLLAEAGRIFLFGLVSKGHIHEWAGLFRQMLDEVLREMPGENPTQRKPLAELEKTLKFSFEKEIVERIDGTVEVYVVEPEGGGAFPEMFVVSQVKESDKFVEVISKIFDKINEKANRAKEERGVWWWATPFLRIKRSDAGGMILFTIDFVSHSGEKLDFPYTPTIGISKDRIIFGTQPQTVRSVLRVLKEPLPIDESFKTVLKAAEGKNLFAYINLPRIASYAYNTGVPALRSRLGKELKAKGVDLLFLPDVRTFARHFSPVVVSASAEGSLFKIDVETERRFGFITSVGGVLLYLALCYLEQYFDPKSIELRKLAALDLKVVGELQKLFNAQNEFFKTEKRYASSLEELVEKKLLPEEFPQNSTHKFIILGAGKEKWSAVANPRPESALRRYYFIDETGTVRISDNPQVGPHSQKWEPLSRRQTGVPDRIGISSGRIIEPPVIIPEGE
ncbi:MAG: hypothetical protein N2234_08975, partial [Planctomycetota bacterium]|nr:hypothetical protein [Planctomycetota bacterium]